MKPPKNRRHIYPRCCAYCKWYADDGWGAWGCKRNEMWATDDTGSLNQYHTICDHFRWDAGLTDTQEEGRCNT